MRVAWLIACFVPKQLASWVDAVAFQYARGKGDCNCCCEIEVSKSTG